MRMQEIADKRISGIRYLWWQIALPILAVLIPIAMFVYSESFGALKDIKDQNNKLIADSYSQQEKILFQQSEIQKLNEEIYRLSQRDLPIPNAEKKGQ